MMEIKEGPADPAETIAALAQANRKLVDIAHEAQRYSEDNTMLAAESARRAETAEGLCDIYLADAQEKAEKIEELEKVILSLRTRLNFSNVLLEDIRQASRSKFKDRANNILVGNDEALEEIAELIEEIKNR